MPFTSRNPENPSNDIPLFPLSPGAVRRLLQQQYDNTGMEVVASQD